MRHRIICAALGAAAISLLAACSSGPGTAAPSPTASPTPSSAGSGTSGSAEATAPPSTGSTGTAATRFPLRKDGVLVAVALRKVPGQPVALVDGFGSALYMFDADQGGVSVCNGECTKVWNPVKATSTDVAGGGARDDLIGKITRDDGSKQLSYNGHPLYYYVGTKGGVDTDDGVAHGMGGGWWLLNGDGDPYLPS